MPQLIAFFIFCCHYKREASRPSSGPTALTSSASASAIAIKASIKNSIVPQLFKFAVSVSIALSPGIVTLAPAQTPPFPSHFANSSNPAAASGAGNISVSTQRPLSFSATQGSTTPATQSVTVTNGGNAAEKWSAKSDATWLTVKAPSNSLAAGQSVALILIANPTGLGLGIHTATVTITNSSSSTISSRAISATLTVSSIIPGYPLLPAERTFPADTGMINVKTQFGAKGDGVTDDTLAIQTAISRNIHGPHGAILYFPAGVYPVSSPLVYKDTTQTWSSALTLQGENQSTTIIKLTDKNPLYQNTSNPEDVLDLGSQSTFGNGGGNNGFDNYVFDLTIDSGTANPAAVALDFMGNNYCGLRNVTLKTSDPHHVGSIGLSMLRYAAGPCLMKNVVIDGFDYGIKSANTEYSTTFESLTLLNQGEYGIYNSANVLSIRGLVSTNRVPAIYNQNGLGLVTLLQASLNDGSPSVSAIVNSGTLYARSVKTSGYISALANSKTSIPGKDVSEFDSGPILGLFSNSASSLNLAIKETPQFEDTNLADWANVIKFGADPSGLSDSSAAIQAAIDSGAITVYFPTGKYQVNRTIFVRGKVRLISGFDSYITPSSAAFQSGTHPSPLFQIESGRSDVTLNHFQLGSWGPNSYPGIIFVEQNSSRPLILVDSAYLSIGPIGAIGYQNTASGTGDLFVEDVSAGPWKILTPQNLFARQINPEVKETKILNSGGKLWILGLKTEQGGTNIETENGGSTEVLGGLLYPAQNVPVGESAFVANESHMSLIYAVTTYMAPSKNSYANFQTQITETQKGLTRSLPTLSLPSRGYGIMMPLYTDAKPTNVSGPVKSSQPDASSH